jgi:hypothetical protein
MNIRTQIYGVAAAADSPLVLTKQPKGVKADDLSSIPVSRATGRCGDTRLADRPLMVIEPVRVTWKGSAFDVQAINRGPGGAMITADFQPLLWDRVELAFHDGRRLDATVVWMKHGRIGLEFAELQ